MRTSPLFLLDLVIELSQHVLITLPLFILVQHLLIVLIISLVVIHHMVVNAAICILLFIDSAGRLLLGVEEVIVFVLFGLVSEVQIISLDILRQLGLLDPGVVELVVGRLLKRLFG